MNPIHSFVISLMESEERRDALGDTWRGLGVKPELFLVERDLENGERGCFESHVRLAREISQRNYESAIVFEDDVQITKPNIDWGLVHSFMENCENWDILYLGIIPEKMWLSKYRGIAHVYGNTSHAYILSKRGIRKLKEGNYQGTPFDVWLKNNFTAYSVFPFSCTQAPETGTPSAIQESRRKRGSTEVKDERFWRGVLLKQYRYCLLKYTHKSIACRFSKRTLHPEKSAESSPIQKNGRP